MAAESDQLIKSGDWFPALPEESASVDVSPVWGVAIGGAIGLVVMAWHSWAWGALILVISGALGLATYLSPKCRHVLNRGFHRFGQVVGHGVAVVTLTPLFLVGFTTAGLLIRLLGRDPLRLRRGRRRTYWLPSDSDDRKRRYSRALFATDPQAPTRGLGWAPVTALAIGLLVAGELLLRFLGYGDAVLYTPDPLAGYYPAPHQDVTRFGGTVATNQFGMRAPDVTLEKPPRTIRVLMLGDSTLYGGQYIDQPRLYARMLERRLRKLAGDMHVEVLNMGVNGWGPYNKLGYVNSVGTFEADICLICLPVDDLGRPMKHIWDTPYFRASAPPRLAYEEVLYHLNWRQRESSRPERRLSTKEVEAAISRGIAQYVRLANTLRAAQCEVRVEVLPSRTAGMGGEVPAAEAEQLERLGSAMQADGFLVGFPAGLFSDGEPDEMYHDGMHLEARGHAVYAEYLTRRITETAAWLSQCPRQTSIPTKRDNS